MYITKNISKHTVLKNSCVFPNLFKTNSFNNPSTRNFGTPAILPLQCKTAVVLGGDPVLGPTIAGGLLNSGAKKVIIAGIPEKKFTENIMKINTFFGGKRLLFQKCDLGKQEDLKNLLTNSGNIDLLVNAGNITGDTNWENTLKNNTTGITLSILLALKYLQGGTFINISGICGIEPIPPIPVCSGTSSFSVGLIRSIGNEKVYNKTKVKVIGILTGITGSLSCGLENISKSALLKDVKATREEVTDFFKCMPTQKPEAITNCILAIMSNGKSGDIWICEGGSCYKNEFKRLDQMTKNNTKK